MFKWINRRKFPVGCTVQMEYYARNATLGRYKENRVGVVVGYPTGSKLLVRVDKVTNYQQVYASNCTRIESIVDTLQGYRNA